ncbi:MAG: 2Fe-2S iron-sulfur cluster binding domain-containing protein [Pirellulaceae bacterium]|nr:2Fe-2S iron-sulfur cluster binding domain-containing protein [Pirellulaceae bacterium]
MRDSIVFYVNGDRHEIRGADAMMTMAQWLRERCHLVGTKVVCNEGDCGACSVLVGRVAGDQLDYRPIDSCIMFLFQLDKTHVITVEGLGSDKVPTPGKVQASDDHVEPDNGLSAVQQAMVDCHGSQCGFCTPGFVTTLHAMLEKQTPLDDGSLRYGLSGNLCRCTGYLQIVDAAKSIDPAAVSPLGERYPEQEMLADFKKLGKKNVRIECPGGNVLIPRTIKQVVSARSAFPKAVLVAGATDYGVLHNHGKTETGDVISLCNVIDFDTIKIADNTLQIGGGATWTDIEQFVQKRIPQYHEILTRFGSPQIRNAGTLAGNLAGGSPIGDSIPFHLVMDSTLDLTGPLGTRSVKLSEFYLGYRTNVMANDEFITSIATPLPKADERVALFKISKRRDMDISTETLGVWVKLDGDTITAARLAIGGVGSIVMRIKQAEEFLVGRTLSEETMQQAGEIARGQITPWTDVRGGAEYRLQLAENLLVKSFYELSKA